MRKILISLLVVALVAGGVWAGTRAYFTDTETSKDNTFSTGTIDIAVDGSNPWTRATPYHLTDMKPSQTDYINFVIHNVGSNPVNVNKILNNFSYAEVATSEPKCQEINGTWTPGGSTNGGICTNGVRKLDIDSTIKYDMRIELYKAEPVVGSKPYLWETIYTDSDNVRLSYLKDKAMYLGMIPVGHYMKVKQSYHMDSVTGNAYQGEQLKFDIVLDAQQLTNTLVLEDKYEVNTDVSHHVWSPGGLPNGKDATLTYKVKDSTFNYDLSVEGMQASSQYTLIAWEADLSNLVDAWPFGNFTKTTVLANVLTDGSGIYNVTGKTLALNKDLINAKVWLVPGNLGLPGATNVTLPWDSTNTLFETGMVDYYYANGL